MSFQRDLSVYLQFCRTCFGHLQRRHKICLKLLKYTIVQIFTIKMSDNVHTCSAGPANIRMFCLHGSSPEVGVSRQGATVPSLPSYVNRLTQKIR
jgi:hypothetical protein